MSDQENGQISTLQRPTSDNPEAWKTYWKAQGCRWRTEPEIDAERQKYLAERRAVVPDIEKGIYPFRDIKMSRADVEWLLATHENGRGPIEWGYTNQEERIGLDLRGADLRRVDLHHLPLASIVGGLSWFEGIELRVRLTAELRQTAMVHLEGAILEYAHLENADLQGSHLEGAYLDMASLEMARLNDVHLTDATLRDVNLEDADISEAHLQRTQMDNAYLEECNLTFAHLEGANLDSAHLAEARLHDVFFDSSTRLDNIHLGDERIASLYNIHWGDVNLTVVNWKEITMLGDEKKAQQKRYDGGESDKKVIKSNIVRLNQYNIAALANRQLSVVLQNQGLNEDASRFAYRAQKLQRIVLRRQKKFGQYLFSGFLDLLAGYGYRPGRSVIWYLVTIIIFALAYHFLGGLTLYPPDAFVFSIMSFHGRGFFPALSQETNLHNPLVMLAAAEAIIGLLIEISFIATFTQRFFGR